MNAVTIKWRDGYKAQLTEDVAFYVPIYPKEDIVSDDGQISLTRAGYLTMRSHYAWDVASGPAVDWPLRHVIGQSLGHDAICQLHDEGHLTDAERKQGDRWFYSVLKINGMPWVRRKLWYRGVRIEAKKGRHRPRRVRSVVMKLPEKEQI